MTDLNEEREKKKRAIFDAMSPKRQRRIAQKVGYDNWDPFQEPKYPVDLRQEEAVRKAMALTRAFLEDCGIEQYSDGYIRGVREISKGLIEDEDRYRAMFDFCCWYREKKGVQS